MKVKLLLLLTALAFFMGIMFGVSQLPAQACGIGQPATMYMNTSPAMAFPGGSTAFTHALGLFADDAIVGQNETFTENVAGLPNFDPTAYLWLWQFGDGATATGMTVAHRFTLAGVVVVRVSLVSRKNPQQSPVPFDSAQVTVSARAFSDPPVVHAATSATVTAIGTTVMYDGTGSYALVGQNVRWFWNFGDGSTAEGAQVSHRFFQLGSGSVALTVMDARGAHTSVFLPIKIVPALPQPHIAIDTAHLTANTAISFDARTSTVPSITGNGVADYLWDFGDGSQDDTQQAITTHRYRQPGSYRVTLTITDMTGLTSSITQRVTITAQTTEATPASLPLWIWVSIGGSVIVAGLLIAKFMPRGTTRPARFARQRAFPTAPADAPARRC